MTELERPRELGEILSATFALLRASFGRYVLITASVVIPIQVIVFGVGLGELSDRYIEDPSLGAYALDSGLQFFLTTPLVTAMVVLGMTQPASTAGGVIQGVLERFVMVIAVTILYVVACLVGLVGLIVGAIVVGIRLTFGVQALIDEDLRPVAALRRSWRLTAGAFWRTLGITLVIQLLGEVVFLLVSTPFEEIAKSADSQAVSLLGSIVGQVLVAPAVAIGITLLYFDLRARHDT